ncbi:p-loop containing nucleoside triphosphate hydrolase protein [Mycena venus]|uniref:p-loop containing nucleoside triphosphate hydrolase protein n=1 Tax=Mycena venus TaxID=2733690 RepID=A0A8H7CQ19_9AGAR|nr:p-loop containing nucleoside triphosphate hydrolase protein [Mycena venus]
MEFPFRGVFSLPVKYLRQHAENTYRQAGYTPYSPDTSITWIAFLVALATLLLRISTNRKAPTCLPKQLDVLVAFKILFGAVYTAGTVAMLVCAQLERTGWALSSAEVATAIAFTMASISEHYHSIAPSTLTSLFAVFGTAFYAYPLRGLHDIHGLSGYLCADAAAAISLLVLIFLESMSKRSLLIPMDPPPAYESTLSLFVKPFFPHVVPLLRIGQTQQPRSSLPLSPSRTTNSRYLAKATFRAFSSYFLSPIFPRLLVLAGTFAQVTLVEQTVLYVSDNSIPKERGTSLIAAYFVVYISLAISNYVYSEKINAFVVLYRSALTGTLYAKTLRLTSTAARELGQGAATTYMSVDVEKVTSGFRTFQGLWADVVTIIVACNLLWYKAGNFYVMCAPLLFIIALIGTTSFVSRFVGAAQKVWLKAVDSRIKLLTSVLGQLLPIKLGAYEAALEAKINALRQRETEALGKFMYYIAVAGTLAGIGGRAGGGDLPSLDVTRVFTLFTIVSLLNNPLNSIGQQLPNLFAAFASLGRIQGFLQLPEKPESKHSEAAIDADLGNDRADADVGVKDTSVEVSLVGCTFAWEDRTNVLTDITLKLVPRELHMVVGSVASGKSSLLMSILEETTLIRGMVKVKAQKIALASQTPFIYPGTLRANILLDSAYNESFYDQVIHACGLRLDIETLPHRDMTKLGDKGTTLSGGQRQRLAIARAVYARADLVLLDDVFSALDGETEAHVFASLFGPNGMLKGKTTVLVTHGIHHLPNADKVVIMDAGTITHFGSFEEVRDAGATFPLASIAGEAAHGQVLVKEDATAATVVDEEQNEELKWAHEQTSRRSAYAFYIKCTGVAMACGLFALIAVWSGLGVFSMVYLSMLTSSSGEHLGLWVAGYGGVVAATVFSMLLMLLHFSYTLSTRTAPNIHRVELAGVMRSPISWITKNPVGKILNRFSQDIQVADQEFPFAFVNFAMAILGQVGTVVFVTIATPLLALALPFLLVLGAYFLRFYLATSKQLRRLESASKSPLYTLFGTTVSGLITVRAYQAQNFFRSQNAAFVNESQGAFHHRVSGELFLGVFMLWFQTILACGVAVFTVWLRDTTSPAFLGVALSSLVSLGMLLTLLLNSYASVENGSIAIDRIKEFAKLPMEEKSNEIAINRHSAWPSAGSLTFSDFSMKYRDDFPLALKNLSFDLQGGLKIGICGRTGSGKSSTVLALFRGIDQHLVTGKIIIDGVDISTVPLKDLRESMSIVTQDPFLWHGSIRENLDVTNACTDSEIWETLKLVEMYDAVSALDDKLDHLVVDEESFSKGQRQLLCLARAMLRKKKIIVLDESTSSMDHLTDQKIRHVVDTQMHGLTVLAIAHRISTIVNYDKILVLDSGSVAEFDDPKVLLSNPESRFARLAATQGIYHLDLVPNGTAVKKLSDGMVMVVTEDLIDV